ncbi:transposase [Haloquadratum walsbyi]|uniref:transposase n=1 Tax=Haloquadratum walsbyi TaxID=293091 RepID=UPI00373FCAA6
MPSLTHSIMKHDVHSSHDVGANNTLSIDTSTGETTVYHARPEFEQFQQHSERIAALQSELPDEQYSSQRIQCLHVYDERTRRRDHSRNAVVKHAVEWLLERNVDTVYVGNLSDVLTAHRSSTVNRKHTRSGVTGNLSIDSNSHSEMSASPSKE